MSLTRVCRSSNNEDKKTTSIVGQTYPVSESAQTRAATCHSGQHHASPMFNLAY